MVIEETTSGNQSKWQVFVRKFGWNRTSYTLMSVFLLTVFLIMYVWWPLAEEYLSYIDWEGRWWLTFDWLLVGIFLVMSLLIMSGADLRHDLRMIAVGLAGGLVIESWGTQTELWTYYTLERPPLWIIPAWPIAALSIDRLVRLLDHLLPDGETGSPIRKVFEAGYWLSMAGFAPLMLVFVWPTLDKSFTWAAIVLVIVFVFYPADRRIALLTFIAGSGLGYFLELWGTTRQCWTYYTFETPPLFAVLAHGMAALAFWQASLLIGRVSTILQSRLPNAFRQIDIG